MYQAFYRFKLSIYSRLKRRGFEPNFVRALPSLISLTDFNKLGTGTERCTGESMRQVLVALVLPMYVLTEDEKQCWTLRD